MKGNKNLLREAVINRVKSMVGFLRKLIIVTIIGNPTSGVLAGDGWYQTERLVLIDSLVNVLVINGACVDKNDCTKKQLAFVAGEPWGLDIYIYGIGDVKIISGLVMVVSDQFFAFGGESKRMKFRIKVAQITKKEEMDAPFWKKTKHIEILMEGKNYAQR